MPSSPTIGYADLKGDAPPSGLYERTLTMPAALASALSAGLREGCGEVVIRREGGPASHVFLSRGGIAWIASGSSRDSLARRLTARQGVPRAALEECFAECRASGGNFAETVVARGHLSREAMRETLLEYNAAQLLEALESPAGIRAEFVAVERGYSSTLLYTLEEVLATAARLALKGPGGAQDNGKDEDRMADINESLEAIMELDGSIAASIVDWGSGLTLGTIGGGSEFDIDLAASGNTRVVKAKMAVMAELGIEGAIEDILITLESQYHIIRPLTHHKSLFLYVALDKAKGNLGLARHKLKIIEQNLAL